MRAAAALRALAVGLAEQAAIDLPDPGVNQTDRRETEEGGRVGGHWVVLHIHKVPAEDRDGERDNTREDVGVRGLCQQELVLLGKAPGNEVRQAVSREESGDESERNRTD